MAIRSGGGAAPSPLSAAAAKKDLYEIGEIPLMLQAKLLRVAQDGRFQRIGSNAEIRVNARILAATNRNLEEEVKSGRFREDSVRVSSDGSRAVFVRQIPEEDDHGDIREPDHDWETKVFELDLRDPQHPRSHEVKGLDGVSWPSFLGEDAYAALNVKGRLVTLEAGDDAAQEVKLRGFAGRPAKPVGSPDGARIAFLASALPCEPRPEPG